MADHVKSVLKQDGKLVAYWQRSVGRPWVAVKQKVGQFPTTEEFESIEQAEAAAVKAREAAFEKERQDEDQSTE